MPTDIGFGTGTLYAFLLVLSRVTGAFVFVPLPSVTPGTELPRIFAAVAITIALIPSWPKLEAFPDNIGALILSVVIEAAFGLAIGLSVACLNEMLKMGAQIMSTQAGFGYASTVDPNTSADAGLLVVAAQMVGGLLFFAMGLDKQIVRLFAQSLVSHPPGTFRADPQLAEALWHFAGGIFSAGVRLAFPAIALLGLVDLSLGLLGRINSQLHLISVAMPVKLLVALALIAVLAAFFPRVVESQSGVMLQIARRAATLPTHGR